MEVCNIVFSGTPRQTIKSRMRTLGLYLVRCPANVQEKVRKARPQLAGFKVISLIAKRDVAVLEAYHQSRAPNERSKFFEPYSPNLQESSAHVEKNRPRSALLKVKRDFSPEVRGGKFSAIPSVNATSQNVLIKGNQSSVETTTTKHPTVSSVITATTSKTQVSPKDPGSESDDEFSQYKEEDECSSSDDDDNSDDSHVEGNLLEDQYGDDVVPLLEKRKLDSTQFKKVVKEMKLMHIFYASELNYKRRSPRMTHSTWTKHVERLITFFSYASDVFNQTPALALVDDTVLVESFLKYLQNERRIQPSTAARYVHSLLITAKYIHVNNSCRDYEGVESVQQLRVLRQQLDKAHIVLKSMPSVRLFWPQYQELVRSLFRKYDGASGAVKARLHMKFTMLLLFAVNPGRGKELRSLRLLTDVNDNRVQEVVKRIPEGDNVILFSNSGSVSLIEKGYKTVSKYGTNVVEFDSEFQFLTYHLREYGMTSRLKLLPRGATHDTYFVNSSGMPFNSSGSFSKYLSRLFKQHLGFPCAINEMRHSLVEHFRSSPESSDTKLAESLARVCKHNLRTQINIYDRRTEPERRSQALRYLNRSAENFILDEAPGTSADLTTDEEERDDLPSPGEMCALVPSDASFNDPKVLLAKVLKYTADGKNARLAWFKELDSRPNHFEFQVGTDVWQEKSSALIYPVDVRYHRSDGVYELRTPKQRIYAHVRN